MVKKPNNVIPAKVGIQLFLDSTKSKNIMAYEKELQCAEEHLTTKYDPQFQKAEEVKWYPWVGKEYDKTGILIVGISAYYKEGATWSSAWRKFCDEDPRPNHVLVSDCLEGDSHLPFETVARMFIEGSGKEYESARKQFWSSISFMNFCQELVKGVSGKCKDNKSAEIALQKVIKIISPKLILIWTTDLSKVGYNGGRTEVVETNPKRNTVARLIGEPTAVVGILHPSRWWWPNTGEEKRKAKRKTWMGFLRTDYVCEKPINKFLQHLKQQPTH